MLGTMDPPPLMQLSVKEQSILFTCALHSVNEVLEFRSCWKEVLVKLDVNLWEIWRKFKCRRTISDPPGGRVWVTTQHWKCCVWKYLIHNNKIQWQYLFQSTTVEIPVLNTSKTPTKVKKEGKSKKSAESKQEKYQFECMICQKLSKHSLQKHMERELKLKPHVCETCQKRFKNQSHGTA